MNFKRLAGGILLFESVVLVAAGLWLTYEFFAATPKHIAATILEIIFAFGAGAGLYSAGKGVLAGKRFGRSPAIVANVIALPVGNSIREGGYALIGFLIMILAMLTIGSLILEARASE